MQAGFNSPWWTPTNPIYVTPGVLADSLDTTANIAVPGAPNGGFRTNAMAVVPLSVPAGTYSMTVYVGSNFVGEIGGADTGVGVYIDGVYSGELVIVANGVTAFVVPLDGLAHSIDLYNGFEQNFSFPHTTGTYVTGVTGKGITFRTVASVARKLAVYGDSITGGMLAAPIPQNSWPALSRAVYPGRIALEAWGGRRLADDAGASGRDGLGSIGALATRLIALAAGAATRQIVVFIGTNDWGNGPWNAATFASNSAALADALFAGDPGASLLFITMLLSANEAGAGFDGATKPTWRAAQAAALAGKPNVTVLAGTTFVSDATALAGDGLHPTTLGSRGIFDGTGGKGGSNNMRSALVF